jgi:hypothetical protein
LEALWGALTAASAAGHLMCASVPDTPGDDLESLCGLVEKHSYSVLGVQELTSGVRLVHLRNPWGSGAEWNGDWSDDSQLWSAEATAEVGGVAKGQDGLFYMALSDFCRYYSSLDVVAYRDGWLSTGVALTLGVERCYVQMSVTAATAAGRYRAHGTGPDPTPLHASPL